MKSIKSNVKRASAEMLILTLLCEGDKYGYQMTQEIRAKSEGIYTLFDGSIYPILYRLADYGDIEFKDIRIGVRTTRVYYHITDNGREHLRRMRTEFRNQIYAVDELTHFSNPDFD